MNTPIVCLVFLILTLTNAFSFASNKTLYASVPAFPPFNGFIENKLCTGINKLAIQAVTKDLTVKLEFSSYPYARILHSLQTGELDLALILKNNQVNNDIIYIGPLSFIEIVLITPSHTNIQRYEDLHQLKKIAVIRNAQFDRKFDHDSQLNKVSVDTYEQAIKLFKAQQVDGVIGSKIGLEYALHRQNMKKEFIANAYPVGRHELGIHLAKKSPFVALLPLLTSAVKRLYQENYLYQLYQYQINHCLPQQVLSKQSTLNKVPS